MNDENKNISIYSIFLIRLAWVVEIIAVLIGFTISVMMAISAASNASHDENSHITDILPTIIISGLPFLLVAVVELCKIPLVFTFMHSRNIIWKGIFLFFVLFLCIITFETMLNGFERNFSNLNKAIDLRKNKIISVNRQIDLIEKRKAHIQTFTEEDLENEINTKIDEITNKLNSKIKKINTNRNKRLKAITSDFKIETQQKIDKLTDTRDEYYRNWTKEKESVENRFSTSIVSNISGSREERQRLIDELEILKEEMKLEVEKSNFFTEAQTKKKYRKLIKEKEQQLSVITTGYLGGGAIEKQSLMENQLRQQIEFINKKYENRVNEINERIDGLKKEIAAEDKKNQSLRNNIFSSAIKQKNIASKNHTEEKQNIIDYEVKKLIELELINQKTFKFDEDIFILKNDQRLLNAEINHLINQNQVYRLAMYVSGKESASQLDKQVVGIVAAVWFGSLALIASVTGMMLAIASFYLRKSIRKMQDQAAKMDTNESPSTAIIPKF